LCFLPDELCFQIDRRISVKNIFVGNLDFNVTEEAVRSLFERHGVVNSARIMTDRDTGRSRGFAFVEMENETEADQAIAALNGFTMDGRALNVNEARPKPDRGFGGSGGGGNRSGGGGGGGGRRPGGGGGGGGGRPSGGGRREPRW
jgi:cold-inducible RNA-binding protein